MELLHFLSRFNAVFTYAADADVDVERWRRINLTAADAERRKQTRTRGCDCPRYQIRRRCWLPLVWHDGNK